MSEATQKLQDATLQALLEENRIFKPSKEFVKAATIKDDSLYKQAAKDREKFWAKCAEKLDWIQKWDKVLEWNKPYSKWFVGGKLNASYNCLDRHIKNGLGSKTAIIWEGEVEGEKKLTYQDVYESVNKMANALKNLGKIGRAHV